MQKSIVKLMAFAAVALGLLSSNPAAFAQAITTSSLNGTVMTDSGQPIAGAAVTVTHEPTGSTYTTTSRSDGTFVLRGLRPGGPYTVATEAGGYNPSESREVHLDLERGADVSLRMKSSEVVQLEAFTVTADAADQLFDPNQMGSSTYHDERDLRNLPTGDRSINSLARLDPKISYNRDPQDRAISVSGLSNRYNSIQVDGVSASDPFGLNANNTAAERNVIPMDSLEALSVTTSADVRRTGFVGAQINAITKSGTNEFKGSLYYTYRNESLVGDELDGQSFPLPDFKEQTWGATLGGPIIPRKLFFYLAYENVKETRIPPSPANPLDAATLTQIANAATALGFEPGSATPPPGNELKDENILAKIDWEINQNHRATLRYQDVESSRPTFPGFGTGFAENNLSFDSYWYDQMIKNTSYIGQLISRWGDKLNTEISVSRSQYDSMPITNTRQPRVQIRNIPVAGTSNTSFVTFGTEISRHANILKVETDTAELFASYELSDSHTIQAGVQYDIADVYNLFVQNALGSYDFNSLNDFLAVAANNNGSINYREYIYNQIIPGVEPAALFKEGNLGLFIKDSWRVNPNLLVDFGARIDMPSLPDEVPFNQEFTTTFGVPNNASYDGDKIIQPRAGFNWQPELDGKRTTIRGSAGLYYGRAPRVWISNSYSNTGMNFRTFRAGANSGTGLIAPAVSADPDNQPTTASGAPAMQVAFMNPDFELPSKWKANLAIERELGFWDLHFMAEIEKMWTNKDVFYSNINIDPTRTGPDGRTLYFNSYGASASGTRLVDTGFTNRIIQVGNTDQGESQTITLSISRPRKKDGWSWTGAYVNTNASEVLFGTSSVASSNWQNRSIFNTNEQEEHRAELEVRHRFTFHIAKEWEFVDGMKTTASMFYEGRSGYPFSITSSADTNGDSVTGNDLLYIPNRNGDPAARFATTADRDAFYRIVDRFGLQEGQVASAGGQRYPWVNTFDVSLKQEVKLPGWRHRLVLGVDVLNIGNLLNDEWGLIRGSNEFFVKREQAARVTYDGVANQYVYSQVNSDLANGDDFSPSLGRGEPAATRWSVLFSARYEF